MAMSGPERPGPPRARAASQPSPTAVRPPRRGWTRIDPHPKIPPALRAIFDQCLVAGPVLGVLSALYGYHLTRTASPTLDAATGEIIRQSQMWHGHFLRSYYITEGQNMLWWALSIPAIAWLILLVCTVAVLGVRANRLGRSD